MKASYTPGLVSIIMPAFNAQAMIANAVQSVLCQSYENWELLIVSDDGRDYQSILSQAAISDSRIRFYSSSSIQSGPNAARNIALKHAHGEWLMPLDADDVYFPERISTLVSLANKTGLSLDNVLICGEHVEAKRVYSQDVNVLDFPMFKQSLVPLLFCFHREHIHFGWDEDITRGADTIFNLRALESAGEAAYFSEPLHEYRVHNASMCHAAGAEQLFIEAYRHTLHRLNDDGLGFATECFRKDVIAMIKEKQEINLQYETAVLNGYEGNYQSFAQQQLTKECV